VGFLDDLKRIGFHYATLSGISIAMQDLIIPSQKSKLIESARKQVDQIESDFQTGGMSEGERYNKVIDVWHQLIAEIETALFDGLAQGRDDEIEGFNPVHIMVDSGAIRGGKRDSIRQLSGLRGLMTKPSGEIIEQPIESCFHEGLSVLEYFISTHGARKGLADTAIKTASSGYLTRKLVDVAQDVMVRMHDCGTLNSITKRAGEEEADTLAERIFGRAASEDITDLNTGELLVLKNSLITHQTARVIEAVGISEVRVRSVLTCEAIQGTCAMCYGTDLTSGHLIDVGEAIGIIAAQSIGEPGTQLTMRTFHTGGTVSGGGFQSRIEAHHNGTVQYENISFVERPTEAQSITNDQQSTTEKIILSRNAELQILDVNGHVVETHKPPAGSRLCVEDGQAVTKGDSQRSVLPSLLLEWDPYRVPILTEHVGRVVFRDIIEGKTMREDKATGLAEWVIIEYRGEDQPRIEICDEAGEIITSYLMPTGAHLSVADGELVESGTVLARIPSDTAKSKDIVTGLPRVTELFEARRPKDAAVISEIDGYVKLEGASRGVRILRVVHDDLEINHRIPQGKHLIVQDGDKVKAGDKLTDGLVNPHDILKVEGEEAVQCYLVDEVQDVYRKQGERINDKHIEVIVRQMLNKAQIKDPGDTEFLEEDEVDKMIFYRMNHRVQEDNGDPATAETILQGITKASLSTESFISAASFQQTTNVLTRASVVGKRDRLVGLKENVIMGHLIPAGTGVSQFRKIHILPKAEQQPTLLDPSLLSVDEQAAD
jgi:DNA-directed RNA polymerase subunit beta'